MKNVISIFLVAGILLLNPISAEARLLDNIVQNLDLQVLFPWISKTDTVVTLAQDCAGYTGSLTSVQDFISTDSQLSVYHCLQDKTSFEAAGGDAQKYGGIAMGRFSLAQDEDTIAIGDSALAEGTQALSIGRKSKAQGKFATALGFLSKAEGRSAIAIGHQSEAIGSSAVSLNGHAEGSSAIAIGSAASARGTWSRAIGVNAYAYGDFSTVLGVNSHADGGYSVAIGDSISSKADHAFTFGTGYTNDQGQRFALVNDTPNSLIVGFNSSTPTLFVGDSVSNGNTGSVGIGTINPSAKLDVAGDMKVQETISAKSLQIQENARIGSVIVNETLSAGKLASDSIVAGTLTSSLIVNHGQFASGGGNSVSGEGSATIGMRNRSVGNSAITLGYKNMAVNTDDKSSGQPDEAKGPVALGYENIAHGTGSIAMGSLTEAKADHSIAIGHHATSNGESSIAIGHNIANNHENSLLIGFEDTKAIFATHSLRLTKRMIDLKKYISDLEQRITYYSPYLERYSWLRAHVVRWQGFLDNYQVELAELTKNAGGAMVGINTDQPKQTLHISGAMRLEPLSSAPEEANMGDMFMHKSGALCVFVQRWEVVAGDGNCY